MLFRRGIEPQCGYCKHGSRLYKGKIGCKKNGIVDRYYSCRRFSYDPYARVPEPPMELPKKLQFGPELLNFED